MTQRPMRMGHTQLTQQSCLHNTQRFQIYFPSRANHAIDRIAKLTTACDRRLYGFRSDDALMRRLSISSRKFPYDSTVMSTVVAKTPQSPTVHFTTDRNDDSLPPHPMPL